MPASMAILWTGQVIALILGKFTSQVFPLPPWGCRESYDGLAKVTLNMQEQGPCSPRESGQQRLKLRTNLPQTSMTLARDTKASAILHCDARKAACEETPVHASLLKEAGVL